jgi:hypothetical protein
MLDVQTAQTSAATPGPDRWRPAFVLAGPAAITSIVLVFAAAGAAAGDAVAMASSGLGIASNLAALVALVAMVIGLAGLPAQAPTLRQGFGRVAWAVATIGTILTAGGYWSSVFVQPDLAHAAPDAIRDGLSSLTAGFVVSYLAMGLGWALTAIALLRARLLGISGWFLIVAALVAVSPLPFRYLPLAVAVSVACGLRLGRRASRG